MDDAGESSMTSSPSTEARPALDKKKTIIGALVGVIALVVIFVKVIPQIGSYADALTAIRAMSGFDIAVIVIAVLVYNAVQLNQGAFAISNGIPAGGAFGLGVQYAMLASYDVPATVATAAIGAVGVWSIFVTLGLPVFGLLSMWASGKAEVGAYIYIGLIGFGVLVAMIVVFALVMRSEKLAIRLGELATRLAAPAMRRLRAGEEFDGVAVVLEFRSDTVGLVRRRWGAITAAQLGVSVTQFLIFFAALGGVEGASTETSILVAFGAFAVSQIGIMIPITPGGLGTVDALMIQLLISMGVDTGTATAATLVWRAASFVPQIAIGVLSLVTWSRRAARAFAGRADSVAPAG